MKKEKWFQDCLDILDANNYGTVAMPYGIGCRLAGGKWKDYKDMIEKCSTKIILYKLYFFSIYCFPNNTPNYTR